MCRRGYTHQWVSIPGVCIAHVEWENSSETPWHPARFNFWFCISFSLLGEHSRLERILLLEIWQCLCISECINAPILVRRIIICVMFVMPVSIQIFRICGIALWIGNRDAFMNVFFKAYFEICCYRWWRLYCFCRHKKKLQTEQRYICVLRMHSIVDSRIY